MPCKGSPSLFCYIYSIITILYPIMMTIMSFASHEYQALPPSVQQ